MVQAGDISEQGDGSGGISIYTEADLIHHKDGFFEDENIWYPHSHRGTVSTHFMEKNKNGSQFIINLRNDN